MAKKAIASYGSWDTPITSDLIVSKSIGLTAAHIEPGAVYWLEARPSEKGRNVIVKRLNDGTTIDLNPPPFNVRTRVHEYGGGAFLIFGEKVYFSNFADQRLYQVSPGTMPVPITPDSPLRYADYVMDSQRNRIICVREDHQESSIESNHNEAINSIIALYLDGSERQVQLASGNDFYASPRISPDGKKLAWLTWNHPNMPWDGTELWIADINTDGQLDNAQLVAGGKNESIFQPDWSPDGILNFVSDRTGWWNIYRLVDENINCVAEMEAEFGVPQWVFGLTTYVYVSSSKIACIYTKTGNDYLAILDADSGRLTAIDIPYTSLSSIKSTENTILFRGAGPNSPNCVLLYNLETDSLNCLKTSSSLDIDPEYISIPESITYPTIHDQDAHALFYPPKNPNYLAPEDEKPPLVVICHGGPTSVTKNELRLSIQYWTSRGFAILHVNYGGSTGYGRNYRERLLGNWGIIDVDDCVDGALYLANKGDVDINRLAIKGGSAGGYTTLSALAFRDVFHAGASYFGVSDLEALALDTHKFESRYLDSLIGPYPQTKSVYIERSPIHNIKGLNCPMIFFQGSEDRVVPPDQAQKMVDALVDKGIPVAFILFEGEQHGFRQSSSIKKALDSELYFFGRVFNFKPAGNIEPVTIQNLE